MFLGEIMWTKDDYFKVLKKTGFEQLKGKKSDEIGRASCRERVF